MAQEPPFAWQPLTPRGISAFAYASGYRLLGVQIIFALLAAAVIVWFLQAAWFPTVWQGIRRLPDQGDIRSSRLNWTKDSPYRLAEGRFLSLAVDLKHTGEVRSPAHVHIEFGQGGWKVYSLFGYRQYAYPKGWVVAFNRSELEPWWGAWSPIILTFVAGAVTACLLISWAIMATVYFLPVWVIGFFANRDLSLRGSWRLSGAALMPGAVLFTLAIVLYGLGLLDPVRLLAAAVAHIVVGWLYLFLAPLKLLPHPELAALSPNPFTAAP